jgi:hypothetical protein
VLTHFSARYSRDASELLEQARQEFGEVVLGRDGLEIEVLFRDESASQAVGNEGRAKG